MRAFLKGLKKPNAVFVFTLISSLKHAHHILTCPSHGLIDVPIVFFDAHICLGCM